MKQDRKEMLSTSSITTSQGLKFYSDYTEEEKERADKINYIFQRLNYELENDESWNKVKHLVDELFNVLKNDK